MSLAAACGWSLLRCLAITLLSIPLCRRLSLELQHTEGHFRKWLWAGLLVPFFTPELLVGYAYANFSLSLIRYPVLNELLYALLLAMKLIPLGAAMLYFAPPTVPSVEAIHCRRLAFRPSAGRWSRLLTLAAYRLRGPARAALPAVAVLFLLSFQEFEMASLLQATSWTVWLFDAQAGGLFLADSLRYALLPVACEAVVIVPVLLFLLKNGRGPAAGRSPSRQAPGWSRIVLYGYVAASVVVVCLLPLWFVGRESAGGFTRLLESRPQVLNLLGEILAGLKYAAITGGLAYFAAILLSRRVCGERIRSLRTVLPTVVLSFPGLLGPLALSLVVAFLFQQPGLNDFYNTPLPLVLGLVLFLLPRGVLIQLLLPAVYPPTSEYPAALLQASPLPSQRDAGRALKWRMRYRGHFWGMLLLGYWVYWELTAAAILSPVGVTTAPVRLYNLMHYGHNAVLSATTAVAVAVPFAALLLLAAVRPYLLRVVLR